MEQSRYGKYKQVKTPEHKRSRFLPASFEDRNKYFRCWNCNFICSMNANRGKNKYPSTTTVSESSVLSGDENLAVGVLKTFNSLGVGLELAADGDTAEIYSTVFVDSPVTCPFCGTNNLP